MLCATAETLVCAGCTVYVGQIGGALLHLENLPAGSNIARPQQLLAAGTAYSWRVDTHTLEGLKTGEIWSFTTGHSMACEITPHPPPRPAPPGPVACAAAEKQVCPGLAGKGASMAEPCFKCVVANNQALHAAGCWDQNRHAFIEEFCGPNSAEVKDTGWTV